MLITRGEWPNAVQLEQVKVTHDSRLYRVTASPNLATDHHPMVEIWIPECMHGRGDLVRYSHWRRLKTSKRSRDVAAIAKRNAAALPG